MAETRYKDRNWIVSLNADGRSISHEDIQLALQMDIRDELKILSGEMRKLNSLLHCSNFIAIPGKLDRIGRNTAKPRKNAKP